MSNCILITNIIYGKTLGRAIRILDDIILHELDLSQIVSFRRCTYTSEVVLKDGTKYKAVCAGDGCRGLRFNQAIIDCKIDKDTIENCIEPYGCYSTLPDEKQIVISEFSKSIDI